MVYRFTTPCEGSKLAFNKVMPPDKVPEEEPDFLESEQTSLRCCVGVG
jgi:hypothetical protein